MSLFRKNAVTSKKDLRDINYLEYLLNDGSYEKFMEKISQPKLIMKPPCGGSAVSRPKKTTTVEKFNIQGNLIEKIVITEE